MYYRADLTISPPDGGRNALEALAATAAEAVGGESAGDTWEGGTGDGGSYWHLTVERPTLDWSGDRVRLELRAHQIEGQVICRARLITRYLRGGGGEAAERATYAPRLITSLNEALACEAGGLAIQQCATRVTGSNVPAFIAETLSNEKRSIPVVLVTEAARGEGGAKADALQRAVAGVATVALVRSDATRGVRNAIGRATYGGKMRVVEPGGPGASIYYEDEPGTRTLIADCVDMALPTSFEVEHESLVQTADARRNNRLDRAEAHVARLEALLAAVRREPENLEPGRQQGSNREPQEARGPDYVTVLNHAINLARDPLRRYVVNDLQKAHGTNAPDVILRMRGKKSLRRRAVEMEPEAAIDINDMPHLLATCGPADGARNDMTDLIREVKQARNLGAHPPVGGISAAEAADKLDMIGTLLGRIGADSERDAVAQLIGSQWSRTTGQ